MPESNVPLTVAPTPSPPGWHRRLADGVGLRGRLAIAFGLVLSLALVCCWCAFLSAAPEEMARPDFARVAVGSSLLLLLIAVPLSYGLVHQLTRHVRDLERKVRQRTAELETANRRLSAEIAEREDLIRAVSHDLNAPLRNISGMASMLLMKYGDRFEQDVVHRLERIQKNVQAETDLISELLELSRIKTRRRRLEHVEIEALVCELTGVFDNDLKSREITLTIDTPLPVLHCERARIRQVFLNLIDNAVKYMGEGLQSSDVKSQISDSRSQISDPGPRIKEIHVGCRLGAGEAEFYVRDTGVGIDPEDAEKIFYVFRRGKTAAGQGVLGKGVGLSSVKTIVETYGGRIWVRSAVGKGSTFHFTVGGAYVPALAGEQHVARHEGATPEPQES